MATPLDPQAALISTMVIVSAADANMSDSELSAIGEIIGHLPIFRDFDRGSLPKLLNACAESLGSEDGLEATLGAIREALPPNLRETAYAIACDLVAADGEATQEEMRTLELLRLRFDIDRLIAFAIERGARARFQTL